MVRKSTLVLGILFSAWFVLDVAATNAEACGGCRRRSCGRSSCCARPCCPPPVCSPCGSCGGSYGSAYNTGYAAPSCSSGCSAGNAAPGYYGYAVRNAPNYGPAYVLARAGVPSMTYASNSGYAAPVSAYRSRTVFRTAYATPLR